MNRTRLLLLLVSVACTWACIVPTLDEIEQDDPGGCDETHPCREGSVCFEGECIPTAGLNCIPGSTIACGNPTRGECRQGTRLCDKDGNHRACTGEVVAKAEVCNGKDDDCDGTSDEALFQDCAKQRGVCAGAREMCANGAYKGCTTLTYGEHSQGFYQPFETSCEFQDLDNDCDGQGDKWNSTVLIEQPGGFPLGAIGVNRISSRKPPTVLALIPSNGNLETHAISAEGIRSGSVIPPAQGLSATSSVPPVLVADEDRVTAAWIEQSSLGPTLPEIRLHMAVLDGGGAMMLGPVPVSANLPQDRISDIQLAVGLNRVLVLVTFEASKEVWAFTISRNLDNQSKPFVLARPLSNNPWVHAVAAGGANNAFLVTFEDNNNRQLGVISEAGLLLTPATSLGQYTGSSDGRPFIIPTPSADLKHTVLYVRNMATLPPQAEVLSIQCSTGPNGVCDRPLAIARFDHHIEDMKMLVHPGLKSPSYVLLKWKDPNVGPLRQEIARYTADKLEPYTSLPLQEIIFSDVLVLSPEGTFFLVYLQSSGPTSGSVDAKVLPFCGQ